MNLDSLTKEELFVLLRSQKGKSFFWFNKDGALTSMSEKGWIDIKKSKSEDDDIFEVQKTFRGENIIEEIEKNCLDGFICDKNMALLGTYSTSDFFALEALERKGLVVIGNEELCSLPPQEYVVPTEKGIKEFKDWVIKKYELSEKSIEVMKKSRSSDKSSVSLLEKHELIKINIVLESCPLQYECELTCLGKSLLEEMAE